nr:hypothetical protein [Acidobacteriota bacterium]
MRISMNRQLLAVLLCAGALSAAVAERAGAVTVPAGTRIMVELGTRLASYDSRVGERIRGRVVSPIYERGYVAIARG